MFTSEKCHVYTLFNQTSYYLVLIIKFFFIYFAIIFAQVFSHFFFVSFTSFHFNLFKWQIACIEAVRKWFGNIIAISMVSMMFSIFHFIWFVLCSLCSLNTNMKLMTIRHICIYISLTCFSGSVLWCFLHQVSLSQFLFLFRFHSICIQANYYWLNIS